VKKMDPVEKNGVIDRWVKKHLVLYTGATRHPFILSIRDGTIDFSSFKRWLVRTLFTLLSLHLTVQSITMMFFLFAVVSCSYGHMVDCLYGKSFKSFTSKSK
jgi:hypothetical protein